MNQHALIIGVESYRDPQITPVHFARAEAADWEDLLRGTCRFQTVKRLAGPEGAPDEPTQHHVFDALYEISGTVKAGDHFVLVFGGHGTEVNGRGFLMLSDCRSYSRAIGVLPIEALREDFLKPMAARWCTVILDSCRNDPDAGRGDGEGHQKNDFLRDFTGLGERRSRDGRVTTVLSACKQGERAYASNRFRKGVWSHFLHEGIRGAAWKDGVLGLRELANYAHERVREWSATEPGVRATQEPWMQQWGTGEEVELARDPGVVRAKPQPEAAEGVPEPLPPGAFGWYHGSPAHLSRMSPRCSPVLWIGGKRVETDRAGWLVRQGVAEIGVRQGALVAESSVEALVAGGQTELLRAWLDLPGPVDPVSEVIGQFLSGEPMDFASLPQRVRNRELGFRLGSMMERWRLRDRPEGARVPESIRGLGKRRLMHWRLGRPLVRVWGKAESVEEWYRNRLTRTPESPVLADTWIGLAGEAAHALGSVDLVEQFAARISTLARDTASCLALAELHGRHFGEAGHACGWVQDAERRAQGSRDLADTAAAWLRLLGEPTAAQRCAEGAAARARDCPDWIAAARARWTAGRDPEPVLRALQTAERSLCGVLDRVELAEAWMHLAGEQREAERVLQVAELGVVKACDWFLLGGAWGRILGASDIASRCLNQGIGRSASAFEWRTCAVTAMELGVDPAAVRGCVDLAASVASTPEDWCWASDAALVALDSRELAAEYLEEARRRSQSMDDWLWCARSEPDPESAVEFLDGAERLARASQDLRRCTEAWVRNGWDLVRGRRCLLRAEAASRTVLDWRECAGLWERIFMDQVSERRCERAADGLEGRKPGNQTTLSTVSSPRAKEDRS